MERPLRKSVVRQSRMAPKSLWGKVSASVTSISVAVCLLAVGFTFYQARQKEIWEERLNQSKEQLDAREKEAKLLSQELDQVKQTLKVYVEKEVRDSGGPSKNNGHGERSGGAVQVTLMKSQSTNDLPDIDISNLNITVVDLIFKPDPPRYTVTARIAYRDLPEMRMVDAEQGYKVRYPNNNGYDIQLLKVNPVSATFALMKSSN